VHLLSIGSSVSSCLLFRPIEREVGRAAA